MRAFQERRYSPEGEQGYSLVELLMATAVGLSLAALLGHTLIVYQTGYRRAMTHVSGAQQAQFALSLMAEEVGVLLPASASATCPTSGIRVAEERLEFAANLYDRSTFLREDAAVGQSEVVVDPAASFEIGDLVMVVNVNAPNDPGDDVTDCFRIADMDAGRWTLSSPVTRAFPIGSPVALINRVAYARDRQGRLMRTQDGGAQRIAQGVEAFDIRTDGATVTLTLTMRNLGGWTRRVMIDAGQR